MKLFPEKFNPARIAVACGEYAVGMSMVGRGSSLALVEGEIVYREADGTERWRLLLSDVMLLAEHTKPVGDDDDYFLEFGTLCDGEPCLTECAVPGDVEGFLAALGEAWGKKLTLKLGTTTTFASRVLWPERLAGRPLFVERETARFEGAARLRRKLFGGLSEWVVSAEVFEAMQAASVERPPAA